MTLKIKFGIHHVVGSWSRDKPLRVYPWDAPCMDSMHADAHKVDIDSFLYCSEVSLQEQYTQCDIEKWVQFVPVSWRTNPKQPNFTQHLSWTKCCPRNRNFPQEQACQTRHTATAACPYTVSLSVCRKLGRCSLVKTLPLNTGAGKFPPPADTFKNNFKMWKSYKTFSFHCF